MAGRLQGKVAVITGAASGIAAGIAGIMAGEGARLVIADINDEGAGRQAEAIRAAGGEAVSVRVDLADEDTIRATLARAVEAFGGLDVVVNAAADTVTSSTRDFTIETMDFDVWDHLMRVNLRGTAMMTKHAIPLLRARGKGSIVNIASGAGLRGSDGPTAYGATKAGMINLTMYTATQVGKDGIRCNAIAPGLILTPATESTYGAGEMGRIMLRHKLTPRLGKPSDIAWGVVWLASDEAEFVTGQCISIDGGGACHEATWADFRDLFAG